MLGGVRLKSDYDKLGIRLARIITLLLCGEKLNVDELADEFNVTTRTIRTDLNKRLIHLPIVCKNGRYFLSDNSNLKNYDFINFSKKSGVFGLYPSIDNLNEDNFVKGFNYEKIDKNFFDKIQNAIADNQTLNFTYNNKNRDVNPYKLINLNGIWYLIATEGDIIKNFSLGKISNLQISKHFHKNAKITKFIEDNHQTFISTNPVNIRLKVDKQIKEFITRRAIFPNQQMIKECEDGDIIIETKASFIPDILGIISYWIPHISILEPLYLKDELLKNIKNYLKKEKQCF